jgi:hypothetical protein
MGIQCHNPDLDDMPTEDTLARELFGRYVERIMDIVGIDSSRGRVRSSWARNGATSITNWHIVPDDAVDAIVAGACWSIPLYSQAIADIPNGRSRGCNGTADAGGCCEARDGSHGLCRRVRRYPAALHGVACGPFVLCSCRCTTLAGDPHGRTPPTTSASLPRCRGVRGFFAPGLTGAAALSVILSRLAGPDGSRLIWGFVSKFRRA